MRRKILTGIVVILFVISGIYIGHLFITIAEVRETQRQRGIEFEMNYEASRRILSFTAPDESEPSYTRLTQAEWYNYAGYQFFFTYIQEQSDYILLRGVLVRPYLMPEEVEDARTGIEINGETFVFIENMDSQAEAGTLRNAGYLRNVRTEDNSITLFQSSSYFEDIRYFLHLSESERGSLPVWIMTDMYREIEVDNDTVMFVSTAMGDPSIQTTAHEVFTNFTPHNFTDGLLVHGTVWFAFSYGEVIQMLGFLNPDYRLR